MSNIIFETLPWLCFILFSLSSVLYITAWKDLKSIKDFLSSLLSSEVTNNNFNSFKESQNYSRLPISKQIINILQLLPLRNQSFNSSKLQDSLLKGQEEISSCSNKLNLATARALSLLDKELRGHLRATVTALHDPSLDNHQDSFEIIQANGIPLERMSSVIKEEMLFNGPEIISSNEYNFLGIEHRLSLSFKVHQVENKELKVWLGFNKGPVPDESIVNFATSILKQLSISISNAINLRGELSRADEDKDFLLGLSHDLRAPASAGIYAVYNLRKRYGNSEELEDINSFLNEQLEIIDNVLDLAREKKNLLEAQKEEFLPFDVFQQLLAKFKYQSKQNGIELTINCSKNINIIFDKEHFERIMQNFLLNSIRYSKSKQIILSVFSLDKQTEFLVEDFGKGIKEEDQKLLWDKFSRIENNEAKGSYGLGLLICSTLAKKNDAKVFFRANKKAGSIFGLKIDNKYIKNNSNSKKTVLLLEDHPQTARAIINQLKPLNLQIKHFSSLKDAWNDLNNSIPKLVISDYNLRDSNIKSLISLENERNYPLLVLSGDDSFLANNISHNNKTEFLKKPVSKAVLFKNVENLLKSVSEE